MFNHAKSIGVNFSPRDLTKEEVEAFYIIEQKLGELERKKRG